MQILGTQQIEVDIPEIMNTPWWGQVRNFLDGNSQVLNATATVQVITYSNGHADISSVGGNPLSGTITLSSGTLSLGFGLSSTQITLTSGSPPDRTISFTIKIHPNYPNIVILEVEDEGETYRYTLGDVQAEERIVQGDDERRPSYPSSGLGTQLGASTYFLVVRYLSDSIEIGEVVPHQEDPPSNQNEI